MASDSKLQWRCRRGMLELDILLNAFIEQGLSDLTREQGELFTSLLDYPDQVLLDLLLDRSRPTDAAMSELIEKIRQAVLN